VPVVVLCWPSSWVTPTTIRFCKQPCYRHYGVAWLPLRACEPETLKLVDSLTQLNAVTWWCIGNSRLEMTIMTRMTVMHVALSYRLVLIKLRERGENIWS